jgi:uncharacterized protein YabN with tetrapyrrole methylase and pyrophosphatase domain
MKRSPRPSHDIAIVGLGLVGIHQITREVEDTIRRSRHLFVTDTAVGVVAYLKKISPKVTELAVRRDLGRHRLLVYREMASRVVGAALEEPPVCFASYGHPNVYCYPTTLIRRAAQILDLRTVVLPGISSLDTLMSALGVDPGFDGLQIYEATDLLIRNRPLQNDVGCVIYQVPIVLEPNNVRPDAGRALENLRRFQNYLLKFYPGSHTAQFLMSKTHPLLDTVIQRIPLERLAETLSNNANMGTLYIPPAYHRDVAEKDLAERMTLNEPARDIRPSRPGRPPIGPKPTNKS